MTGFSNYVGTRLSLTVDSYVRELYIDGVRGPQYKLPNAFNWPVPDVIPISRSARTIAVFAEDHLRVTAGVLASTPNGLVTDSSWKCTNTFQTGWYLPNFDDSAWPAAVTGNNPGGTRGFISSIGTNAQWIWTRMWGNQRHWDQYVYCRNRGRGSFSMET